MAKVLSDGKIKTRFLGGPYAGETGLMPEHGTTFEFTARGRTGLYLHKMKRTWVSADYESVAEWIPSKVKPTYQFEDREFVNGFSNGFFKEKE